MPLEGRQLAAPVDLHDLLRVGLDAEPDAVAMSSATDRITWRELERATDRLARNYVALGLAAGDRVASLMPNRILLVVHYLACFRAGLVITPLNYRYAPREIDHALEVSGARGRSSAHAERRRRSRRQHPGWRAAADRDGGASRRRPDARAIVRRRSRCGRARAPHRAAPRPRSSSRPAAPVRPRASPTASTRWAGWRRARSTASSSPRPTPSSPVRRCRTSGRSSGHWRRCRSARTSWSRGRSTRARSSRCSVSTDPRSWR